MFAVPEGPYWPDHPAVHCDLKLLCLRDRTPTPNFVNTYKLFKHVHGVRAAFRSQSIFVSYLVRAATSVMYVHMGQPLDSLV